ncbi:MAG: sigma 54-interacting transcriptional regulator [Syntrophaceae bacterium]|nr:sigma 54-interacting transcriptional regulator [Syntrophaceae bacterium]
MNLARGIDETLMLKEIKESYQRCRQLGIDPNMMCNNKQARLSDEGLKRRREKIKDFLQIAVEQIKDLYRCAAGAGFIATLADGEGYILDVIGDSPILNLMKNGNLRPGYRWAEKDVGTSAISLVVARNIPVQINDSNHYCRRGHGYTCSAAPVLNENNELIGVIALSGSADQVHPHTLGMVITAARSVENQMRIMQASQEIVIKSNFMHAIIDSIDSGVMTIDKDGIITQINDLGKTILHAKKNLIGLPLSTVVQDHFDWGKLIVDSNYYINHEQFIKSGKKLIHLLVTARPILNALGEMESIVIIFNEITKIRKLINDVAGRNARFTFKDIIGISASIKKAKKLAMVAASTKSTVLLMGETGTGKELFAQAIHNQSTRKDNPFVAINCAAIPRELLESELFGYVEGSFTGARKGGRPGKFELADGGTIFLDEVGDMPQDMQVKLLRVLQTSEVIRLGEHKPITVDIRVIAASNRNLKKEISKGNFREDLFYRLNVFPIHVDPLREQPDDIVPLARYFLAKYCKNMGKQGISFSKDAESVLKQHDWPGNVRELENVVERAVNMVDAGEITSSFFECINKESISSNGRSGKNILKDLELETIADIIKMSQNNLSLAASKLGVSRGTLYNKIKRYGIIINRSVQ